MGDILMNNYEKCKEFVVKHSKRQHRMHNVVYAFAMKDKYNELHADYISTGACHAALPFWHTSGMKPLCVVSELCCAPGYEESTEAAWAWISDPKESPWRDITKHGIESIRHKDGYLIAWGQNLEGLEIDSHLYKNWCIATRSIGERDDRWQIWHELVTKKGMSKVDAVFLAGLFTYNNDGQLVLSTLLEGTHWPFTNSCLNTKPININRQNGFSFEKVTKGTPKKESFINIPPVNGFWTDRKHQPLDTFYTIPSVTKKTAFSFVSTLEMDTIIDRFYKWKEQYVDVPT